MVLQVLGISSQTGAKISGELEENSDPSLADNQWISLGQFSPNLFFPTYRYQNFSHTQRFIRANLQIPKGRYATVGLFGVARKSS